MPTDAAHDVFHRMLPLQILSQRIPVTATLPFQLKRIFKQSAESFSALWRCLDCRNLERLLAGSPIKSGPCVDRTTDLHV